MQKARDKQLAEKKQRMSQDTLSPHYKVMNGKSMFSLHVVYTLFTRKIGAHSYAMLAMRESEQMSQNTLQKGDLFINPTYNYLIT